MLSTRCGLSGLVVNHPNPLWGGGSVISALDPLWVRWPWLVISTRCGVSGLVVSALNHCGVGGLVVIAVDPVWVGWPSVYCSRPGVAWVAYWLLASTRCGVSGLTVSALDLL